MKNSDLQYVQKMLLERGDTTLVLGEEHGLQEDLCTLLHELQECIHSSYMFGVNPLPGLRAYFPNFEWEYYESKKPYFRMGDLHQLVYNNDYLFLANRKSDWGSGIVSVRRKVGDPFRMCLVPQESRGHTNVNAWPMNELARKSFATFLCIAEDQAAPMFLVPPDSLH